MSLLTIGIASVCVDRSNFATCEALKALGANEAPRSAYQQVAEEVKHDMMEAAKKLLLEGKFNE